MNAEGMLEVYRRRLLDGFLRKAKEACDSPFFVLVVDREALRYLTTAVDMKELEREGVMLMELIDRNREPLPKLHAAYLLTSSAESVNALAAESSSQYAAFHLFFMSALDASLMERIKSKRDLMKKVKSLWELQADFLVPDEDSFSLGSPAGGIPHIWGPSKHFFQAETDKLSRKLANVCSLLASPSSWTVRHSGGSKAANEVAHELCRLLEIASSSGSSTEAKYKRGTILILDRMGDPWTPLLHEFTFQAMIHDVLALDMSKPGGCRYRPNENASSSERASDPVVEDERFPVWKEYKHQHLAQVAEGFPQELKKFSESNPAARVHLRGDQGSDDLEVKDLSNAVRALPEYGEKLSRYAALQHALRDCLDLYKKRKLDAIARVQQDIVMGRTAAGERCRSKTLSLGFEQLLLDGHVDKMDKLRLILLAQAIHHSKKGSYLVGGRPSSLIDSTFFKKFDVKEFVSIARISTVDMKAAIQGMNIVLERRNQMALDHKDAIGSAEHKLAREDAKMMSKRSTKSMSSSYDVSRYQPYLLDLASELVENVLPPTLYPTAKTPKVTLTTATGSRVFVVFVVGGISHSERRTANVLSRTIAKFDARVIVGGSSFLSPTSFIESVAGIADENIRAKVLKPPPPLLIDEAKPSEKTAAKDAARKAQAFRETPSPRSNGNGNRNMEITQNLELKEVEVSRRRGLFKR